jgi:uncharacterized PurR-regulated membrane protein YhhQ (DUF165 family)
VVTVVALANQLSAAQLRNLILSQYLAKVLFAVLATPVIYALHGILHRWMHIAEHPAEGARVHEPIP